MHGLHFYGDTRIANAALDYAGSPTLPELPLDTSILSSLGVFS